MPCYVWGCRSSRLAALLSWNCMISKTWSHISRCSLPSNLQYQTCTQPDSGCSIAGWKPLYKNRCFFYSKAGCKLSSLLNYSLVSQSHPISIAILFSNSYLRHTQHFGRTTIFNGNSNHALQVEPVKWSQQKARDVLNEAIEGTISDGLLAAAAEAVSEGYEGTLAR